MSPIQEFDVLIVGAGVSGIGMACELQAECPDKRFAVLERRQRMGGTWDLFRYPGVRSDSDMFTYGFKRRPWGGTKLLADGGSIRNYLVDTARASGVDRHIRYGLKITRVDWSSAQQCWSVEAVTEPGGEAQAFRCRQLVMSTGYYNHDAGYTPEFLGLERFAGQVVHPQHWPEDLDCRGKRVVVVGSGATAMTLVPALATAGAQVTMLQRSPTYVLSMPSQDKLTGLLARLMPWRWAAGLARQRNLLASRWIFQASRRWPERMRRLLLSQVRRALDGALDMRHFTPGYQPWDQRLCVVPDGDLFAAIRGGNATVVTDQIAGFDAGQVKLASGQTLDADIFVTATGLDLQTLGGARVFVDGQAYAPSEHMLYKGVLLENLPNFAWIVGYTNASWTLKADLASQYLCRLYKHMDASGLGVAVARDRRGCKLADETVFGSLSAGYVQRGNARLPRQGSEAPWRVTHHYPSDKQQLLHAPIADGVLSFAPLHTAATPSGAEARTPYLQAA